MKVAYAEWFNGCVVNNGDAEISVVQSWIKDRGKSAVEYVKKNNIQADHFIYAAKFYSITGELIKVSFYAMQMEDKYFDEIAMMRDCVVYALHKGTSY